MGSESLAHEAEGRMGYWLRGHEAEVFPTIVCGIVTGKAWS